jgi:hypothetical protein
MYDVKIQQNLVKSCIVDDIVVDVCWVKLALE